MHESNVLLYLIGCNGGGHVKKIKNNNNNIGPMHRDFTFRVLKHVVLGTDVRYVMTLAPIDFQRQRQLTTP